MGVFDTGDFILEFENENDQKEIEKMFQAWCQAWGSGDIETIIEQNENLILFGYRTKDIRDWRKVSRDEQKKIQEAFFNLFDSFEFIPISGIIRQVDNVVTAIGFFKEKMKDKEGKGMEVTGRFSFTYIKQNGKWQLILAHRDAQFG